MVLKGQNLRRDHPASSQPALGQCSTRGLAEISGLEDWTMTRDALVHFRRACVLSHSVMSDSLRPHEL